jgi:hypothetical protein
MNLHDLLIQTISDWNRINRHNEEAVNDFLEKHESVFLSFGLFMKNLRIEKTGKDHNTLEGVRAIISMNIEILHKKLF